MALELKGLKGKALAARANLDRLNAAYDAFNDAAPKHAADVGGLVTQVEGLSDDLAFAANVLGNSLTDTDTITKTDIKPFVIQETTPAKQ